MPITNWDALRQGLHSLVEGAAVAGRGNAHHYTERARELLAARGLVLPHLRPDEIESGGLGELEDVVHPLLLLIGSLVAMDWTKDECLAIQKAGLPLDEDLRPAVDHLIWVRCIRDMVENYLPRERIEVTTRVNRAIDWMVDRWSTPR